MTKDVRNEPVRVSKALEPIVGARPHTRGSVTRALWKYIRDHDLVVAENPTLLVRPNTPLAAVLGTRRTLDAEQLTEGVSKHIEAEPTRRVAPARIRRRTPTRQSGAEAGSNRWLWVTKPEFHTNPDGSSALQVGPFEGWWTCNRHTNAGDLVLLYRAKTKKDIGYLILATTDAFSINDDPFARERGWEWACEFDILYAFDDPIPLSALRADEVFWKWSPLGINFQGRVFPIGKKYWDRLIQLALPSNRGLAKFVGLAPGFSAPRRILAERELEESLAANLANLRQAGWDLELWRDTTSGRSGRQFVCAAAGGRIDLLCKDRKSGGLVVVELKNVIATEQTYMQTWRYLSWVQRFLASGKPVAALVVARGCDSRFELMAEASDGKVRFLSLTAAGFE